MIQKMNEWLDMDPGQMNESTSKWPVEERSYGYLLDEFDQLFLENLDCLLQASHFALPLPQLPPLTFQLSLQVISKTKIERLASTRVVLQKY